MTVAAFARGDSRRRPRPQFSAILASRSSFLDCRRLVYPSRGHAIGAARNACSRRRHAVAVAIQSPPPRSRCGKPPSRRGKKHLPFGRRSVTRFPMKWKEIHRVRVIRRAPILRVISPRRRVVFTSPGSLATLKRFDERPPARMEFSMNGPARRLGRHSMPLERWVSGSNQRFAKPSYGVIPVPGVRIPPSPFADRPRYVMNRDALFDAERPSARAATITDPSARPN